MAKLSAELRTRAQKELQSGVKASVVAAKFGISASACTYLKSQATGATPAVAVFEEEFNSEQLARFKRLLLAGESINDLAKDYETPKSVLVAYCNKNGLPATGAVVKLPKTKKIKITARGNGKRK
jgi:hypothetical protein